MFAVHLLPSDGVTLDFSPAIQESMQIKIHKTISVPVVYVRVKLWLLALRNDRKLKMVEHMVQRNVFGPETEELKVGREYCTGTRRSVDTSHKILLG
jgi:hypothetical protein